MIERCTDFRRIKKLLSWQPLISNDIVYLMEVEEGKDLGVWTLHNCKGGVQIHADMGEGCRGEKAVKSAQDAFKWVFENTGCDTIYAKIDRNLRGACHIAVKSGMELKGRENERKIYQFKRGQ